MVKYRKLYLQSAPGCRLRSEEPASDAILTGCQRSSGAVGLQFSALGWGGGGWLLFCLLLLDRGSLCRSGEAYTHHPERLDSRPNLKSLKLRPKIHDEQNSQDFKDRICTVYASFAWRSNTVGVALLKGHCGAFRVITAQ